MQFFEKTEKTDPDFYFCSFKTRPPLTKNSFCATII